MTRRLTIRPRSTSTCSARNERECNKVQRQHAGEGLASPRSARPSDCSQARPRRGERAFLEAALLLPSFPGLRASVDRLRHHLNGVIQDGISDMSVASRRLRFAMTEDLADHGQRNT